MSISKRLKYLLWVVVITITPRNKFGDRLIALYRFYRSQKRFPSSDKTLSNELYRLKISDEMESPIRVFTSDKYLSKFFVKAVVGEQHVVPTIAVLHTEAEVRGFDYPKNCCIKPTHCSGLFFIRKEGADIPLEAICSWLGENYYYNTRERNYKSLKPAIIVEPLIFDQANIEDYKFTCYNNQIGYIQVITDRAGTAKERVYDADWNDMVFTVKKPRLERNIERPECFNEMIAACKGLAQYFSLVRIDFYVHGNHFYVGEITHCPEGGDVFFVPREMEATASRLLFSPSPSQTGAVNRQAT